MNADFLITLLIVAIIVGAIIYVVDRLNFLDATVKMIVKIAALVVFVIWLLVQLRDVL